MPGPDPRAEARRVMEICNACRYCEGFCAVFPAMERRRAFSGGDLDYLAHLCHGCRGCYYACPYTPPHEFAVNVPRALADLRARTYAESAWPRALGGLFRRNGLAVSLVSALSLAAVLVLTAAFRGRDVLFGVHRDPGAFYVLIPFGVMVGVASLTFGFALVSIALGTQRAWRRFAPVSRPTAETLVRALGDVLSLRYLGGGGQGCHDRDDSSSQRRRRMHHFTFYGFGLCFASTSVAAVYEHVLGLQAPYPFWSLPVLLGTAGGMGMVIGTAGLAWLKLTGDPAPASPSQFGADAGLLFLLGMTAATGLLLLALRDTPAMGVLLAVHLGFVLALFLVMPFSRFVHGPHRAAALLRFAIEQRDDAAA
jgi:citrate/tricarballylate utilization protein